MDGKPIAFRLPLPISKNDRVRIRHRKTFTFKNGRLIQGVKAQVFNTEEWKTYVQNTILRVKYELGIRLPHPKDGEKILIECWWYLRNDRTDCVNFHDLLADALKEALEIDDRHFLVADLWSEVDEKDPGVLIMIRTLTRNVPLGRREKIEVFR